MADDKTIVTKKTAPKAAADSKTTAIKKTVAAKPRKRRQVRAPGSRPHRPRRLPQRPPLKKRDRGSRPPGDAPATSGREEPPPEVQSTRQKVRSQIGRAALQHPRALEGKSISLKSLANVSEEERLHMIHEAAYYRAEKRRFAPGHEVEDWAEAEREIDELLANAKRISGR
jgi:hypothetical protein